METSFPFKSEIVRVISLTTTEITEIIRFKKQSSGSDCLNPFPNNKFRNLDSSKMKEFADDNFKFDKYG